MGWGSPKGENGARSEGRGQSNGKGGARAAGGKGRPSAGQNPGDSRGAKSGGRQKERHMPAYLKTWTDQQTKKLDAFLAKMQKAIGSMEGVGKGLGGGAVAGKAGK